MAEEIRLSKSFIETELPQAPPLYVSVYLMTLAVGQDAKKVAERLKATETDVLYAWGYWKGKGYLQEEKKQETERPALVSSVRPDYSPRELALYIKNDKVRKLFDSAQKKLGKMLSQQDMSLLFSFYDWLVCRWRSSSCCFPIAPQAGIPVCAISKRSLSAGQRKA